MWKKVPMIIVDAFYLFFTLQAIYVKEGNGQLIVEN